MAIVQSLATRHLALRIVGPALMLAQSTVQRCNALLDAPDDDSEEEWQAWLATHTEGLTKLQQLTLMQERLGHAMGALQLALLAVNTTMAPQFATSPFAFVRAAFNQAQAAYLELEMGRTRKLTLCGGELWQRGLQVSGRGGTGQVDAMQRLSEVCKGRAPPL
jgi:hypothetical protein